MKLRLASLAVATALLTGCASSAVRFYTLGAPAIAQNANPLNAATPTVSIDRIALPDYLDTQDMYLRDDNQIIRSPNGRWASRLSQGATDFLAARLGQAWPHAFVTDQPQAGTADERLTINISRLDISHNGQAALDADWTIIPKDEKRPVLHNRASFSANGTVATDSDNARLTQNLLDQLSRQIAASTPAP